MTLLRTLAAVACAVSLLACTSPTQLDPGPGGVGVPEGSNELPAPRPWTQAFRSPALVVADSVYVEGPRGLLDHIAARTEDGFHSYVAETLPEGFQQRFEVLRPEAGVELRAYLDAYEIVAFRELIVLERPGELDVLLRASGDTFWRDVTSGAERRGPEFSRVGRIEKVLPAETLPGGVPER
jgi:hypothetical protein